MSEPRLYPGSGPDERASFAPYGAFEVPADLRRHRQRRRLITVGKTDVVSGRA